MTTPRTPPASVPSLRWGDAATRAWAGGWAIVGGGIAIAGSNTNTLWLLGVGVAVHVTGWCIMPAAGWRRLIAIGPSTLAMFLLLGGPRYLIALVVSYLLWLLVRHRPGITALTAIPVLVTALIAGEAFSGGDARMLPALVILSIVVAACGLLARAIATHLARRAAQ